MFLRRQGRPHMSTRWLVASVVGCVLAVACSSSDEEHAGGNAGAEFGNGTGGLMFGGGGTGVGATGAGATTGGGIDACNGSTASCASQTYAGENLPLDIYIMFDQS